MTAKAGKGLNTIDICGENYMVGRERERKRERERGERSNMANSGLVIV